MAQAKNPRDKKKELRQGALGYALRSPCCDAIFRWEVLGLTRVKRKIGANMWVYSALCPACRKRYQIEAPKEKE